MSGRRGSARLATVTTRPSRVILGNANLMYATIKVEAMLIFVIFYRWVIDSKEHRVRTTSIGSDLSGTSPAEKSLTVGSLGSSVGSAPSSLPTFQHPSHALLKENGFTQQVYTRYRARCLKGTLTVCVVAVVARVNH